MKLQKIRLPILIGASVLLCLVISVLSLLVIRAADNSMTEDKIQENRASMQMTADRVQQEINAKYEFICGTVSAIAQKETDFDLLLQQYQSNLAGLAERGGFAGVLLADAAGNAYDADGTPHAIKDADFYALALTGRSGISGRVTLPVSDSVSDVIVYYAPVQGEDGKVTAVLCGLSPAQLTLSDYTDSDISADSGMYVLNEKGEPVMSSLTADGGSFYEAVKESRYADGTSDSYRLMAAESTEAEPVEGPAAAEEPLQESSAYYAGDMTRSGRQNGQANTGRVYLKQSLAHNGWTLFYVRSVPLSERTVSFMIMSRVLLLSIVLLFLAAMAAMLLLQWGSGKKITELAYKDEITGRANWQKFVITCNSRLNNKSWWTSKYAALHVDINRFTIYNDYYGHKAGNRLLQYLAETMDLMCSAKEMCARRSSDRFVVLWAYSGRQQLDDRINDLFRLVKDGPNSENVSLSVGVYLLTEDDKDIVHAVDMACLAEESISEAKVNTVAYFDEKLRAAMTEEHELEKSMQSALENDEFKLYIQPKHCVQGGELGGAEALVRWISPEKGFISPGRFIPLFEKNGFVGKVDNYILEELCKFQQKRLERGQKTVPISVNVSRVQLSDPHLAEEICGIVDRYGVPHRYIDLELTESACFDDMETLIHTINTLRSMGFPVSMDDFGSGYSSLNLLKELPFDTLKIDGEFFRNVTDLSRANIVVKNIIDLGKALHMKIVAEGIESEEQVAFLRTTECDLIQGYYYSKPISAKEFEAYMAKNRIREI